ncbi:MULTISPECIES: 3-oxoacid CoA-transferase subunit B [Hyphomicrobiales]|uniref:Acetate CoA/acetoacetate CoA-transferase beta subunit n=2 Tax=Hyphomicrobiales TaxID=356 RepID=A0A1G5MBV1_AFIMA|nr:MULTISPECIES: 3-oxoacid CoA-transferase subunit B [Hyphomicrobiales]MBK1622653.1 succinyl-CoA--3-ketoacid-CoA transferase [Afifella marina DSM 2698]MBK1625648.1 succinyl-CoA--3-ketoacid-CoA transferase [Afifella marina]MBK5917471.1 succinyl-CoA--3-ketoacid-CoA transferase [Afifella marina]MCF1504409.1 3-oxoacid CoA-transferase subunit B [Afifella sp. H1R]MDQ0324710.1 acetate CoA/acetoacetate CoA-transferase beta subunit [Rhodopseudomonas julia]
MEAKTLIAKRVAQEMVDGDLVNLGIGLPTLVTNYLPEGVRVFFQSENGLIGMQALPEKAAAFEDLTDAGGTPASFIPGAAAFDSVASFGFIRGGHLDVTVLGGLQVDEGGQLANWMVPGKMVPGMGGAMDLVTGAKKVIVAMTHTAKGSPKIIKKCNLPLTSVRRVDLIVTEMAVIEPSDAGLVLKELAPGVSLDEVKAATEAELLVPDDLKEMALAA